LAYQEKFKVLKTSQLDLIPTLCLFIISDPKMYYLAEKIRKGKASFGTSMHRFSIETQKIKHAYEVEVCFLPFFFTFFV